MKPQRKTRPALWMLAAGAKKRRSKRALELEQYRKRARAVVKDANSRVIICPVQRTVNGKQIAVTSVHHVRGRAGGLLLDERFWLLVSDWGHDWIHRNMDRARLRGWLCERGLWGKQES